MLLITKLSYNISIGLHKIKRWE